MSPWASLGAMAAVIGVLVVLFWPPRGWYWRWKEYGARNERVLVEDALKHLHACEYRGSPATVESVAGILQVSTDRSAALLVLMESLELVVSRGSELQLTAEGRLQALHVIRVHRLWERYLAERSGLSAVDWHRQAEQREHTLTSQEVEKVDAELGYPRYDPHGDPIPTPAGDLPPRREASLLDLKPGQNARIVHVEDEPEAVFAQIAAMGLFPGMVIRLIERREDRVLFWAEGREHILAPVSAANIAVVPLPGLVKEAPFISLAVANVGQRVRVVGLGEACRGMERQRLLDLGVVPGTDIRVVAASPLGDPVAYEIRGAVMALRRDQAAWIHVEPAGHPAGVGR